MEFTDGELWLHRVSDAAGSSIKQAVFTFGEAHNLSDGSWRIRVYGVPGGYLDAWVGAPPTPTYRKPYSLPDDAEAGTKILDILEHLHAQEQTLLRKRKT